MAAPLTLDNRLLLACARTELDVQHIQALVERDPDWQAILRKTERWGLSPLVYTNLRPAAHSGHVPQPVAERLRHLYHRDTIYGVARRELLRTTLLRFSEASIPVIVLKGAALATLVYPAPALRPMRDLDLLVRRGDRERVDEVVRGLRATPPAISYLGRVGFSLLDIRDHIFSPHSAADGRPGAVRIPIEDFWERARPVQIESVATLVFCPEDLLLYLAFHLTVAVGFVGQVRTLCDIGELCRCYRETLEWTQLIGRACSYGIGKPLYYALRLAQEIVGAGMPSRALTDLKASFGQLPLEERLITTVARRALLSEDQPTDPLLSVATLAAHLLETRRARDGVMVTYRHLARSCRVRLRRLGVRVAASLARLTGATSSAPSLEAGPSDGSNLSRSVGESTPSQTAQGERIVRTSGEVAVTYDQGMTDGVGSQLHRIYGLYALARALDIKYVHSPLREVGYQGLMPMLTGHTDPDFAARYNAFFSLPSDDFDLEGCERVRVHSLDEATVERYREQAAATGRPVLIRGHLPYEYINRHPAGYQMLRAVSPYRGYRPAGPVRVCIHLRRGDNSVQGREREFPRPLLNAYYVRACGTVVEALRQLGAPFVVRLHTEVPPRPYTLHPGIPGVYFTLDRPAMIDPADYALEDFETLPNLEMVLNVEPRECLDDFATADVLILSLSSLGFVGGLLNPHGCVICPRSFHAALPDWLVASWDGELDAAQVATRLAGQLRRRA